MDGVSESEGVREGVLEVGIDDREGDTEADGVVESEGVRGVEGVGRTQGAHSPLPVGGESHHVGNGQ